MARVGGSKSVRAGLGQTTSNRAPCGEFKDDSEKLEQPADLEHVICQREGNTNCRSLECVTHAGRLLKSTSELQI